MSSDIPFGQRLRELREARNLSRAELAELAKLDSEAGIRNLEQGVAKSPKWDMVVALAEALGVSIDDFNEGAVVQAPPPGRGRPRKTPAAPAPLPLIAVVRAGQGSMEQFPDGTTLDLARIYNGCVAYQVKGDSMVDEDILDGDFVVVRSSPTADVGDIVVAWKQGIGGVVKKLGEGGMLLSCDKSRNKYKLNEDEGDQVLGVLVGVIRRRT